MPDSNHSAYGRLRSCPRDNFFLITKQVYLPNLRFQLIVSYERYLELSLDQPILVAFCNGKDEPSGVGLVVDIQIFEKSFKDKVYFQVVGQARARHLTRVCGGRVYFYEMDDKDLMQSVTGRHRILLLVTTLEQKLVQLRSHRGLIFSEFRDNVENCVQTLHSGLNRDQYSEVSTAIHTLFLQVTDDSARLEFLSAARWAVGDLLCRIVERSYQRIILNTQIDSTLKQRLAEQQKLYVLNEKLRVLEEELSNHQEQEQRERDSNRGWPAYWREAVEREQRRLKQLSRSSPEYPQQKKLLEYLLRMPWHPRPVNTELDVIAKLLDQSHYGMKEVKEEVLNFIFLQRASQGRINKILCLVGAPGTGKTSLWHNVATAQGRDYIKINLGGCHDSNFLLGSSRVYVNSLPGVLIREISKLEHNNPLVLLDEIDKTTSRSTFSNTSGVEYSLVEILDAEQNCNFKDNFIEEVYPLNHVFFVATANSVENIPSFLQSRMLFIHVPTYMLEEKVQIARLYIIPRLQQDMSTTSSLPEVKEDVLRHLADYYVYEGGARVLRSRLEKLFAYCLRKGIEDIGTDLLDEVFRANLVRKDTMNSLGFNSEKYTGRVLGMYATGGETGVGGLMPIDVVGLDKRHVPSENDKISWPLVEGNVSSVMQESVRQAYLAALDWLECRGETKLRDETLLKRWVVYHAGLGVEKDGPSAGLAVALGFLSRTLGMKVGRYCFTGEINLRGEVMPIGGVRDKIAGATRHGVTEVFLPRANLNDYNLVESQVREKVNVRFVDSLEEAVALVWPQLSRV